MVGQSDTLVVTAALWVAAAAAGYLVLSLARLRRGLAAVAAAVLAVGGAAGGVASADSPHPRPPLRASLGWTSPPADGTSATVVVRPGDCLWAITARELASPTAAHVAQRWPTWWRANRRVIGPDPNLIRPGEHLHRPGPTPRRH